MAEDMNIEDIDSKILELQRQRDLKSLEGTKAILEALKAGKAGTLAVDLENITKTLSPHSMACQQANNVINVLNNVRNLIEGELGRIQQIVEVQSPASS